MSRVIKVLLVVMACIISWYCGELSQPSPIERNSSTIEFKTYDYNTTTPSAPKEGESEVYVVKGGDERYHRADCRNLRKIYITSPRGAEEANYKYCNVCNPPKK